MHFSYIAGMKWYRVPAFCVLVLLMAVVSMAQPLRVATFNLRFDNPADVGNLWKDRAPMITFMIGYYDIDILGTQEGLTNQLNDISSALPAYDRCGVGRDDGVDSGEHSAIFFKKYHFVPKERGDFWLSETPDRPSLGWDAKNCKRLCSWVRLYDTKAKQTICVFNAHYDHEGQVARRESSKLALRKIKEIAGDDRVLFMGDLNAGPDSEPYTLVASSGMLKDTYQLAAAKLEGNPSFNGFGKKLEGNEVIDHIFITDKFRVRSWSILSNSFHGKFPSDHFPVMVEMEY